MLRWRIAKKLKGWIDSTTASGFLFVPQFASTLRRVTLCGVHLNNNGVPTGVSVSAPHNIRRHRRDLMWRTT